ncbi:MAG: hypothetical protein RMN52_01435 [Anaerolineae bacterium]|nr:hypothetical protein [Candidatus Roseilinea sp.]MDW8448641.1 hypothetical protein [Anaerolineae bacterium]
MDGDALTYALCNGYIDHWLLAGPVATPVRDFERFAGPDFDLRIAQHYRHALPDIAGEPAEHAPFTVGAEVGRWRYWHCGEDHFIDVSATYRTPHYLRAWAYCELESETAQQAAFRLTTNGSSDVWLNSVRIHQHEPCYHRQLRSETFAATLRAGRNTVLVRIEAVAVRECPFAVALRVSGEFTESAVRLPTTIRPVDRRQLLERVFDQAITDRDLFTREQPIVLRWPIDAVESATLAVRLQRPDGRIYAEAIRKGAGGARIEMGVPVQFPEGDYTLVITPHPQELYEGNMRIQRVLPIALSRNRYADTPDGTYAQRRIEALLDASGRDDSIFCDVARMALGKWQDVDSARLAQQLERIRQRADCSDIYLCGLLGARYRFGDHPEFPLVLREPLDACALNFRYWHDQPGSDAMCFDTESHSILFHTCEVLAGQLHPDRIFTNSGRTGDWHRRHGERLAMHWLKQRASSGFVEWDANCHFEENALALTHLADLAEDDTLATMAGAVLDKMLFGMAVNSFKGAFGSTHGRAYAPHIKGAYREPTSGIGRLLWGMGVFNDSVLGTVSLACSNYTLPAIIAAIAVHAPEAMLSRERIVGTHEDFRYSGALGTEVNKVTYKTPDAMLCSVQDYHPGQRGHQQHIWQATLGPEAVAFVNHPPRVSEDDAHRPNFWSGNLVLPRVAQVRDSLIALYWLPDDDWLGFTHAYFPLYAFDEHEIGERWAFARKGEGYLALGAAGGLRLITHGLNAKRELRSYALRNVWVCQVGRAAVDGGFEAFKRNVSSQPFMFDADAMTVEWVTVRGDVLRFGWEGPLLRNGNVEPISGFKHYDNVYCTSELGAEIMDIMLGADLLRLDFRLETTHD